MTHPLVRHIWDSRIPTRFEGMDPRIKPQDHMAGYHFPLFEMAKDLGVGTWARIENITLGSGKKEIRSYLHHEAAAASVLAWVSGSADGPKLTTMTGDWSMKDLGLHLRKADGSVYSRLDVTSTIDRFMAQTDTYGSVEVTQRAMASVGLTRHYPLQFWSEELVDLFENHDKAAKRGKTLAREARYSARYVDRPLTVKVLPKSDLKDGMFFVSEWVFFKAVSAMYDPKIGAVRATQVADRARAMPRHNSRAIGAMKIHPDSHMDALRDLAEEKGVPVYTGNHGHFMVKGNCCVAPLPDGIDIIASADCLGVEMYTNSDQNWSTILFEPHGCKTDTHNWQSVMNLQARVSIPDARETMQVDSDDAFDKLKDGEYFENLRDLNADVFSTPFTWTESGWADELRWVVHDLVARGGDYRWSPFLTKSVGLTWANAHRATPRKLRLSTRCRKRTQFMSLELVNMYNKLTGADPIDVEYGYARWHDRLKVLVVNDDFYLKVVQPTMGGCDFDDDGAIAQVTLTKDREMYPGDLRVKFVDGERVWMMERNPQHKGEYVVMKFYDDDVCWTWKNGEGELESFPEITRNAWPKQILDAVADGDIEMLKLPSEIEPDAPIEDDWAAAAAWRDSIIEELAHGDYRVDQIMADRLGPAEDGRRVRGYANGPYSKLMRVSNTVVEDYERRVGIFRQEVADPWEEESGQAPTHMKWLQEIARLDPTLIQRHRGKIKEIRRTLARINRHYEEMSAAAQSEKDEADIAKQCANDVQAVIQYEVPRHLAIFDDEENQPFGTYYAYISFWYACISTKRKSSQTVNDNYAWGVRDVALKLIRALEFFGIIGHAKVIDDIDDNARCGTVELEHTVHYNMEAPLTWNVSCRMCGQGKDGVPVHALEPYWQADRLCKKCR